MEAVCHCLSVRLELDAAPTYLLDCNCSICRRYGALWAYYPNGGLRLACPDDATFRYRWNGGGLAFHHCKVCGCATHVSVVEPGEPIWCMNARLILRLDAATPVVQIDNGHTGVFWTRSSSPAQPGRHPKLADPERWLSRG